MAAMASDSLTTRRFAVACGVLSQYVRAGGVGLPAPVPAPRAAQEGGGAQGQQLTIFYGGRVVVLDGCPPEKAAELIRLAAAAQAPREPALVDMPIARKASLRRFLAKRKDRAAAAAAAGEPEPEAEPAEPPAKKGKVDAGGEEGASTWLALGSMHAR
ncbi:hypothetical protein ACP4OV_015753 [Aristida adscensionis]